MRKHIKLLASEYEVGDQSELVVCPFCNGGDSGEPSFTMNVTSEGVLYICYRASCSVKGFVPNLRMGTPVQKPSKKQPNPFKADRSPLPQEMVSFFADKFPAMTEEILHHEQVHYSYDRARTLLPLFDVRGYEYGVTARSYTQKPKAINYFDNLSVPKLHFPLCYTPSSHVTLVEDQFSAMILCWYGIPTVCLLGTNLSDSEVHHLAACGIHQVTFFLDADAAHKAISFKKKYSLEFSTSVYYHERDPKDLTIEEIKEYKWTLEQ